MIYVYDKTIRYFKRKLKNKELTRKEWDEYAHENYLFSAFTLMAKKKAKDFEDLKQKIHKEKDYTFENNRKIYRLMRKVQKQLSRSISVNKRNGKRTIELSRLVDELTNDYYDTLERREYLEITNEMNKCYEVSYYMLVEKRLELERFPTRHEWDKFARTCYLLNSESIKYISLLTWDELEQKINRDIRTPIKGKNVLIRIVSDKKG